jgi:hypothetical protein
LPRGALERIEAGRQDSSFCESAPAKAPRREKEAKKLFPPLRQRWSPRVATRRNQVDKSFFGSFFSKKELLAFP